MPLGEAPERGSTRRVRYLPLILATVLASCGDSSSTCLPDCDGDRSYDALGYVLRGSIDWETFELDAREDITVALGDSRVIELDARVAIHGIETGDGKELPFVVDKDPGGDPRTVRVDLGGTTGAEVTFVVRYSASPSSALRVGGPRDDDPNDSVVLYTDSEPDRARQWLVANDNPADRATWSVELSLSDDRDLVANGTRASDESTGTARRVRYVLDKPIPTYLMAFAAGDLAHEDAVLAGHVPFSLWHRAGLVVDAQRTFNDVETALVAFEARLGPYPWDSYAVFLAPLFSGGMENATVTFNVESSGLGNGSFSLNAHELAHHWFGDWVTMRRYEDVWVKEGMATLLAAEADRARRDRANVGRLFGRAFTFDPTDAIVDRALVGLDKYTSGPYERAAWTITQIRDVVGEDAFWASLRAVLADHALGTITGEEFVRAFPLAEPQIAQLLGALETKQPPAIAATQNGSNVTFTVTDPGGTLLAPIELTAVGTTGTVTTALLRPNMPATLAVEPGGYLAPDEADVHPFWPVSFATSGYAIVDANALPGTAEARTAFAMRSAAQQERSLGDSGLPTTNPAELAALYPTLDSTEAQLSLVFEACRTLRTLTGTASTQMQDALAPFVASPARSVFTTAYAACGTELPARMLAGEFAALAPSVTAATAGRLDYLLSFDYGAAAFPLLSQVATSAPTLALRDRAISRLASQAAGAYSAVPAADRPTWAAFFRDALGRVTSLTRFSSVWRGIVGLRDVSALPLVAPFLHRIPMDEATQVRIICDAYRLALSTPGAFAGFRTAAAPEDTLAPEARAVLADPTRCDAQRTPAPTIRTKTERESRD